MGRRRNALVVEALGYLGGVIALAAVLLLAQLWWGDLSPASRLALPALTTIALLTAGAAVPAAGASQDGAGRLRGVLWLLAVGACAGAFVVLGDQLLDLRPRDTWLLAGLGSLVTALPLHLRSVRTAQQIGLFAASMLTAGALGARAGWDEPTLIGLGCWLVAAIWFVLGDRRLPQTGAAASYLGAAGSIVAVMLMAASLGGQVLAIATLTALFAWAVRRQSLGLLAVAAVGTLQVAPSTITFFFPDSGQVMAPLALLGVGAILVATAVTVTRRRARAESCSGRQSASQNGTAAARHGGPPDR
jgi:hypothetical protein